MVSSFMLFGIPWSSRTSSKVAISFSCHGWWRHCVWSNVGMRDLPRVAREFSRQRESWRRLCAHAVQQRVRVVGRLRRARLDQQPNLVLAQHPPAAALAARDAVDEPLGRVDADVRGPLAHVLAVLEHVVRAPRVALDDVPLVAGLRRWRGAAVATLVVAARALLLGLVLLRRRHSARRPALVEGLEVLHHALKVASGQLLRRVARTLVLREETPVALVGVPHRATRLADVRRFLPALRRGGGPGGWGRGGAPPPRGGGGGGRGPRAGAGAPRRARAAGAF